MLFFIFQLKQMNKTELRKVYKQKRQKLSQEEIDEKSMAIANKVIHLNIWNKAYYHIFLSILHLKEINTEMIMHVLQGKDKQIVLSKTNFEDSSMSHFLLTDSTIIKDSPFGIPEPTEGIEVPVKKIDVVFVPLLVFDNSGHRIGYGKGFYDRFLRDCRKNTLKIGLSLFEPISNIQNTHNQDIRLDKVVTPEKIFEFS